MSDQSFQATYTIEEAGRLLGVGRNTAYSAANKRQIPVIKIGKRLLVPKVAFDRLLNEGATSNLPASADGDSK